VQYGRIARYVKWSMPPLRRDVAQPARKTFFDGNPQRLRLMDMARLDKPARPEVKME